MPAPASVPAPRPVATNARIFQRPIVFQPDRPSATLEMWHETTVDGVWTEDWVPVCAGPCVVWIPPDRRYRVSGFGVRTSRELTLLPGAAPLHLEASTGAAWTLPLGVVATVLGGVALTGGFVAYGMAGLCALNDERHSCDSLDAEQLSAGIVMAAGAAVLVTGIALLTTQRTSVNVTRISNGMPSSGGVPVVQIGAARLTPRGIEF
ncbi:MAG TPA: hypothetical protein VER96_00650 [Polyangiaceae bacterium]|nr:hypothetical protein [Polyangiaceae bacterium]